MSSDMVSTDVSGLDTVLASCKNLQALQLINFHAETSMPFRLGDQAKRRLLSLHTLELGTKPLALTLIRDADGSKGLQALSFLDDVKILDRGNYLIESESLSFPNLAAINLFEVESPLVANCVSTWHLPVLQKVTLGVISVSNYNFEAIFRKFMIAHGPNIRSLDYSPSKENVELELLSECSSLEHLAIYYSLLQALLTATAQLGRSTLIRLDIRLWARCRRVVKVGSTATERASVQGFMASFSCFLSALSQPPLRESFTSLKVICLFDMDDSDLMSWQWTEGDVGKWRSWIETCESLGIRLEDSIRSLVGVPPSIPYNFPLIWG
jgi:hypothetical protein